MQTACELQRGLVGGFRTLVTAVCLLFAVLYAAGSETTMTWIAGGSENCKVKSPTAIWWCHKAVDVVVNCMIFRRYWYLCHASKGWSCSWRWVEKQLSVVFTLVGSETVWTCCHIMFGYWLALYPRSNRLDGLQRLLRFVRGYMRDVQVSHVCLLTHQVSEETTKWSLKPQKTNWAYGVNRQLPIGVHMSGLFLGL